MRKLFLATAFTGILLLTACGSGAYDATPATNAAMATPAPVTASAADSATVDMQTWGFAPGADTVEIAADFGLAVQFDASGDFAFYGMTVAPIAANLEALAPRMLIQRATVEMSIPTGYFDDAVTNLRNAAAIFGGYTEHSNLSNNWMHWESSDRWTRFFNISMRVPVARFEEALRHVEGYGEVFALHQSTDDVTGQFVDTQRRMEAMLVQEDRLLELVESARNLQEIFSIEDRLSQVRTQIEIYRGSMEHMGDQAAFSTITVILWEIFDDEEEGEEEAGYTFGQRVSNTFSTSVSIVGSILRGFVIFMAGAIVPLLVLGVIAVIVVAVVRFFAQRAAAKPPKYGPYPSHYYNNGEAAETAKGAEEAEATKEDIKDETGEES